MWETHEVFYLLAVAQVVLLAAVLLREHRRDPSALASTFLLLTVAAHLLVPVLLGHGVPLPIVHLALVAGCSVPFAFWLLSEVHFDDDFRFRPLHGAVLTGLLAVSYFAWLVAAERRLPALVPEAHHAYWALAPKLRSQPSRCAMAYTETRDATAAVTAARRIACRRCVNAAAAMRNSAT